MNRKLKVLIASRSAEALRRLSAALAQASDFSCATRLIGNGHSSPLFGVQAMPDILVLRFDAQNLSELESLAESSPDSRPPLIVVGPISSPDAMRLAVRSGARDFLAEPLEPADLIAALEKLRKEPRRGGPDAPRADVTIVLGAAGGVGSSFVACNLAHALSTETDGATLLVDLDINTAPLASFLDLQPERGLAPAMAEVHSLDQHALQGYVSKHHSGLHLMGAPSKSVMFKKDLDANRLVELMGIASSHYRYIVVDGSHALDDLNLAVLGGANHVIVVVQQSVVQLKQASRLLRILSMGVGVPNDHVLVAVNRHLKRSTVGLDDIRRALGRDDLVVIPNQYQAVLSSIDGGVPMLEFNPASPVAKAIVDLQRKLCGTPQGERTSLLRRALPMFSGD